MRQQNIPYSGYFLGYYKSPRRKTIFWHRRRETARLYIHAVLQHQFEIGSSRPPFSLSPIVSELLAGKNYVAAAEVKSGSSNYISQVLAIYLIFCWSEVVPKSDSLILLLGRDTSYAGVLYNRCLFHQYDLFRRFSCSHFRLHGPDPRC